jgi:hypothetical protein
MVLSVGRHQLTRGRRKSSVARAAVIGPAAVFLAAGGSAYPLRANLATTQAADHVADGGAPCCIKLAAAALAVASSGHQSGTSVVPARPVWASRWQVVVDTVPLVSPAGAAPDIAPLLPVGVASEGGLQVKTILVGRSIGAVFPEIRQIGGFREDPLRWHPDGLALDVMIPHPNTAEGIKLGNDIVAFALKHAVQFGLQDAIWRGVYYTPSSPPIFADDHYDDVHITTTGGGYPNGGKPRPRSGANPRPQPGGVGGEPHLHFDGEPHLHGGGQAPNPHSDGGIIDLHSGRDIGGGNVGEPSGGGGESPLP